MIRETPDTQAMLIEYGFLDNTADAQKLKNNWEEYAEAVVRAIASYIGVPYISNSGNYYTVQKGDNLYKIAKIYNINENLLAELNGLNKADYIYPNQVIVVPKPGVNVYITKDGDTLMGVVKGIKANINVLLSENPNIFLQSDQIIIYKEK